MYQVLFQLHWYTTIYYNKNETGNKNRKANVMYNLAVFVMTDYLTELNGHVLTTMYLYVQFH